jgi:3'(2'), 5'-bisphosphate nucleotidase
MQVRIIEAEAASRLMEPLTALVIKAGEAILAVNRGAMRVDGKQDGSPVTEADLAADHILADGLAQLAADVPTLSEERTQHAAAPFHGSFFLIDPLDGTKEFVAGRDEFTVNLALITRGVPLLGIVSAPALGLLWRGIVGRGAERVRFDGTTIGAAEPIRTRSLPKPGEPWVAAVSRSHGDPKSEAFIDSRPNAVRKTCGSAVKFGRIAEGSADIYPRFGPTCEWDVGAGCAVVTAAGGKVTDDKGNDIVFGHRQDTGFIIPAFVAWGDPQRAVGCY